LRRITDRGAHLLSRREIAPETGCWNWTGYLDPEGYGRVNWTDRSDVLVHRWAWRLWRGGLYGLHVLHRCDNRACFNPDHLYLGTQAENARDAIERGEMTPPDWRARRNTARGERHGFAKLTEAQARAILTDPRPAARVAPEYGVCAETIRRIRAGAAWRHLRPEPESPDT
jgi:hypothetical protein